MFQALQNVSSMIVQKNQLQKEKCERIFTIMVEMVMRDWHMLKMGGMGSVGC